jgi:hypothetical protein
VGAENSIPRFTAVANVGGSGIGVAISAANTKSDGSGTIGTDLFLAFTAGANDSYLEKLRFFPTASVAGSALAATTARVFMSSRPSGATTSANTSCIGEITLPGVTGDQTTTGNNPYDFVCGFRVFAAYTILVSNHIVPNANTAWKVVPFGGDF